LFGDVCLSCVSIPINSGVECSVLKIFFKVFEPKSDIGDELSSSIMDENLHLSIVRISANKLRNLVPMLACLNVHFTGWRIMNFYIHFSLPFFRSIFKPFSQEINQNLQNEFCTKRFFPPSSHLHF
jgi:hypothetical protein